MKHHSIGRFAALGAVLTATALFAGCSSTGGTPTNTGTTGSTAPSSSQAAAPIEITQWFHDYGEDGTQAAVEKYADDFNKSQSAIHVTVVWVPGDYASKLNAALLAGTGPDVFETLPIGDRIHAGQVAPVDDLFGSALSDFNQNNIGAMTVNGHIYGVPQSDGTGMLYYRKSMLSAAGVTPPTTMDELIAAAKKLTTADHKGLFIGNDGCTSGNLPEIAVWMSGSKILDTDKVAFNNDRTVKAFQKMKELCADNANSLLLGAPSDWWDGAAFADGLAAMQWAGQWSLPQITAALGDDFGVVPWPALDAQGKQTTWFGGWYSQVNAASKNLDAAKQFVKWLWIDNTDAQKDWCTSYGSTAPVRQSIVDATPALNQSPAKEFMTAIKDNGFLLGGPYWSNAGQAAIGTALANVVKGADATSEVAAAAKTFTDDVANIQANSKVK